MPYQTARPHNALPVRPALRKAGAPPTVTIGIPGQALPGRPGAPLGREAPLEVPVLVHRLLNNNGADATAACMPTIDGPSRNYLRAKR